jgi:hypothetical protein
VVLTTPRLEPLVLKLTPVLMPPILEIYVLWHPEDRQGQRVADALLDHFRGTTYSGLVGGAVEVYVRSAGWERRGGPPRPLPFVAELPRGLPRARLTAVVPVLGTRLSRAVADDPEWAAYIRTTCDVARTDKTVRVFPLCPHPTALEHSVLSELVPRRAYLPAHCVDDPAALCRELAHAIASMIGDPLEDRLQVFISHTKRHTPYDKADEVTRLLNVVREVIARRTRLAAFFDESDIPAGSDWYQKLLDEVRSSALLIIRTDMYAAREWCQREVLEAKRQGMPMVTLYAVRQLEERGSFVMDHMASVPLRGEAEDEWGRSIERALDQLVDEALKRALWKHQERLLRRQGFRWLLGNAPEPATLLPWLTTLPTKARRQRHLLVMHPDPPLGPDEAAVIDDLAVLAGFQPGVIDVVTPRTYASRGGRLGS